MRGRGLGHGLWVLAFGVVLPPFRPVERSTSPGEVAPVEVSSLIQTLAVEIHKPAARPEGRRASEALGHVLLFTEIFFADIPGVVPKVDGVPQYPGFSRALPPEGNPWSVQVSVSVADEDVAIELVACDPGGTCEAHRGQGTRATSNVAVAALVREVAARMGRELDLAAGTWDQPITRDDYAVLMAGRGAAILYGFYDPVPPDQRGDARRDPIARAVFLDPRLMGSWTVVARDTHAAQDPGRRILAWKFATDFWPQSASIKASQAAALDEEGLVEPAWAAWSVVATLAPNDLRFLIPRARAALRVGQMKEVERLLSLIPARYELDPLIVSMNVAVADAKGGADDALLARWQQTDPTNPEPVRRRIALAVNASEFNAALALARVLAERGAADEAWTLTIGLANDLQQYDVAADAARRLGQGDLAIRLAGRAQTTPLARAEALSGTTHPQGRLARADALLAAGKIQDARVETEKLLKERPWWPEALDLLSRTYASAGQDKPAMEYRGRVLQADPLYYEGVRP